LRRFLGADGDGGSGGAAFDRAAGKILRQLAMPFARLGSNGTVSGGPLFCRTAQIKTLVGLHLFAPRPNTSAPITLRAKGKVMVNIHRAYSVPRRDSAVAPW